MPHLQQTLRLIENFIIIWLDSKLNDENIKDDDIQTSITILRQIVNSIKLFDSCNTCIDFLNNKVKQEKVFLIISDLLGQQLIPFIEHDIKIDSIYIFCLNKSKHKKWAKNKERHNKVKGIYTNIEDICKQLKENLKQCQHELTSIQTLNSKTSKISNHLDASFMYSQLFKEILLSIQYDNNSLEKAKQDFIDFCQIHYSENNTELSIIEEFKQTYNKSSSIWWYTRECFIYSMLNRVLYTQDIEILMKMSFFICDLHRQLEEYHKIMNICEILTVYRGQGMFNESFNRMKENQDGLISFNNFLSTSSSKEVAMSFLEQTLNIPKKIAILFEMKIDSSISSIPFASLDKLSFFGENEHEILFSMHTVFRIDKITQMIYDDNKSQYWHVHLTLTDDNDEQLRQLTEHMRMDLSSSFISSFEINMDPTWRLSKLLVHMGEYDKGVILYEIIVENALYDNNMKLAQAAHYQLIEIFLLYKYDWKQVQTHGKKLFSVASFDDSGISEDIRNEVLTVLSRMKNFLTMEQINDNEFHSTMAEIMTNIVTLFLNSTVKSLSTLEYQLIADRFNYIGWVRKKQGKLSEAWANHERALELLREHLPPTHPRLAITYNYISLLHSTKNNHSTALDYLEKALDIQEKALQPNHPHLAETHFHMSIIFERMNKIDDAFHHVKKAINIGRQAFLTSEDSNIKQYEEQFEKILMQLHSCDELVL